MKTIFIVFIILALSTLNAKSQIIHVPFDQPAIQAAIDIAGEHDTVLVDQGAYFENINFSGKNIVICSHYAISGDSADIVGTIINGSNPVYADTGSCVLIVSGEDSTAVLQGFTVTGGTGTRWEDEHGAGHWYTEGGGILIQYSSPTIKNNIITGNEAINKPAGTTSAGGGAIRCGDGNPHILNNIITNNQGRYGGGIVMNYSGAMIKNNIISGNSGGEDYGGGGLWFLYNGAKPLILENNTIVNNSSALGGGGIRLWGSIALVTNNIFWGNTAGSSPQIQGTTGAVNYCCIEGGFSGTGIIDTNPGFLNNNFILMDNSPCIDAGEPDESYNDPEDPENPGNALYPAKGMLHSDIGAFGGPGCLPVPGPTTGIGFINAGNKFFTASLFPNPATSTITIRINSKQAAKVSIHLCDSGTRILEEFEKDIVVKGSTEIRTDISGLKPGIYIIRISETQQNRLLKFVKE